MKGKVIAIQARTMGEAAARHLSAFGATVALGARRADRINELAKEVQDQGGKALAMATDVTQRDQLKKLVDSAVGQFGRVDVILNNAGVMPLSPMDRLNVAEWDTMIDVNSKGVLNGIAAALPHMKEQKSGQIINTASVACHKVFGGSAVYSATKFAVRVLT